MRRVRDNGVELDANFSVAKERQLGYVWTVESRGGAAGARNQRNTQYDKGLEVLLAGLAARSALFTDALVVSRTAMRQFPAASDRRLDVPSGYPIRTDEWDPDGLRRQLARAQRRAARDPALASSGNNNKRVSLYFELPGSALDVALLEEELAVGPADPGASHRSVERSMQATSSDPPANPESPRQGYVADALYRSAVELHAMALAVSHFDRAGWKVADTSATKPYDLEISKGREIGFIEVKGTSGTGEQINLTAAEVRHARQHSGQVVLFIVHGIHVDRTTPADIRPDGGLIAIIDPFDVDRGSLTATAYTWRPASGEAVDGGTSC